MSNNVAFLVFKKELKDLFRDRKTLIMSVLIPIIIFPVIFGIMGMVMNKTEKNAQSNIKVAIVDKSNSSLGQYLKTQKNLVFVNSNDIQKDVKDGKIKAGIEIPDGFDTKIGSEAVSDIQVTYDNLSQESSTAMDVIKSYVDVYSKQVVGQRLAKRNIDTSLLSPINITEKTSVKDKGSTAMVILSMLLPLYLVLYSALGPVASATDMGAGEKERGTLEPLLTTGASRIAILWGKFFAITVMGVINVAASLAGLYMAMMQKNGIFKGMSSSGASISLTTIIIMGVVSILTTMVFAALCLAISIYARSFKEAQTYLSPITIIVMIPTYAAFMLDVKNINPNLFHIPIVNATLLIKEAIVSTVKYSHLFITIGWSIVYVIISILLARYVFNKESVIFRT